MMNGFDIMSMLPFVLIFGVFYFLILRPQQQKLKKHQDLLSRLGRGDVVVTSGGLIGTVTKIVNENEIQIELTENTRVRLVRSMVTEVLSKTNSPNMTHPATGSSFSNSASETKIIPGTFEEKKIPEASVKGKKTSVGRPPRKEKK
jgi:preprotein translocase subunit YajC